MFVQKDKKGFKDNICQPRMNDFDTKKLSAWSTQKLQLSIERISDTDKSISTLGECLICKPKYLRYGNSDFTELYMILHHHYEEWRA